MTPAIPHVRPSSTPTHQGYVGALDDNALAYALRAALDPSVSDRALRLVTGLAPLIVDMTDESPGKPCFISGYAVEQVTGLDSRRLDDVIAEVEQSIGVITRVEKGRSNIVMRGHGLAARWALVEPLIYPIPMDSHKAAWRLLNPADARWASQHRAWRLCMALVATYGLGRASLDTATLAYLIGVDRRNVGRIRSALLKSLSLPASFRVIDLGLVAEVLSPDLSSGNYDAWLRHLTHHQTFIASRTEDEKTDVVDQVDVVVEPIDIEERRAYLASARARITKEQS